MKTYVFTLWYIENGRKQERTHEETFECDADAMKRARAILAEVKRDKVDVMQIDVFEKKLSHIVSYQ